MKPSRTHFSLVVELRSGDSVHNERELRGILTSITREVTEAVFELGHLPRDRREIRVIRNNEPVLVGSWGYVPDACEHRRDCACL